MAPAPFFTALQLDPQSPEPLYQQLYAEIRLAVLSNRLAPGARLPSSRDLAAQLGIARSTVVNAFEQLLAEGYLEGRTGSGTFISPHLPEELLTYNAHQPHSKAQNQAESYTSKRRISQRGTHISTIRVSVSSDQAASFAFKVGLPDVLGFPHALWSRIAAKHYASPRPSLMGYSDPPGYAPLREAIASYLSASRGIACTAEHILIINGSQQGLDLAARVLLDPGDLAWVEDPGYAGAKGAFRAAGVQLVPVPVDQEGLQISEGERRAAHARLVYITPSHQFPLGVTMSLSRRLALLAWARNAGAWIIEDDYDSEYRYAGRPLAALRALDEDQSVIYIGTFSKVLFPGLRLGYMVVPRELMPAFCSAHALSVRHALGIEQAIVAEFMADGHFARHIRRMRARYALRQEALLDAARPFAEKLTVGPADAGMHVVAWLPPGANDRAISELAAALGITAAPLSAYAIEPQDRGGLVLGYAAVEETAIRQAIRQIAALI